MELLKEIFNQAKIEKDLGNYDRALSLYQTACYKFPNSISAEHNLAALFGDLHRFSESKTHAERALKKGSENSATWLVYARALMGLQKYEEATMAYRKSVDIDSLSYYAHREYGQVVWMMTKDIVKATELLDKVLATNQSIPLILLKSQIFEYAEDLLSSYELLLLTSKKWPIVSVLQPLSLVSMRLGDSSNAVQYINSCIEIEPDNFEVRVTASYIYAGIGDGEAALHQACQAEKIKPFNQEGVACQATALRLLYSKTGKQEYGDRYKELYDYDNFVTKIPIEPPEGWNSRKEFFCELAAELKKLHPFKSHPFGQSVRGGSQLPNLLSLNNPLINKFMASIDAPINQYLKELGNKNCPFTKNNTGNWKCAGIWSVWLYPGGFHENHIHQEGWLSSACYIELPEDMDNEDNKSGWLKLGQPMFPTQPALEPECWVKPEVGHLVLFPSYMWHGTNVFAGGSPRLSIALDIVPLS